MNNLNKFLQCTDFFKRNKKKQLNLYAQTNEILYDLHHAKAELDRAMSNFSFVTDPDLIELYSYQIKAAQLKYNYHLTRAKKLTS